MTFNGVFQIALFSIAVIALTRPLGGYMVRVFKGERTFLSPVLRPVETLFYKLAGVDPEAEQDWLLYGAAMLLFSFAGAPRSRPTFRSTPRSASSPTPTGRATRAKAR